MDTELKVNNRYELLEVVQKYVDAQYVRKVFYELDTFQKNKLLQELNKRKYYSSELEGLIHQMFIR